MERPLPDEVARRVREYLGALVPPDERADAWHELVADARYWREQEHLPVLRLAHQVVLQHVRVTSEAAVLALRDVGITDAVDLAEVLDVSALEASILLDEVAATLGGPPAGTGSRRVVVARAAPAVPEPPVTTPAPGSPPSPEGAESPAEPPPTRTDALRIGFEEDGPLPDLEDQGRGRFSIGQLLVIAIVVWMVIVVLWALTGR